METLTCGGMQIQKVVTRAVMTFGHPLPCLCDSISAREFEFYKRQMMERWTLGLGSPSHCIPPSSRRLITSDRLASLRRCQLIIQNLTISIYSLQRGDTGSA
ncbi:hypothetical protein AVEN_219328-1 [Araneus ventricosus]|uniref:Uncharacterized protein n=1 Tax=Araneus ventricosus TaxID=182803 RepID=A0A4Y2BEL2_ARAVE|nr:hypothetical protein AVEN_219328-1 [Araneus ventricosus]